MPRRRRSPEEADIRARPPRRGSRARTKERPSHGDAVTGWVMTVDRGRYTVLVPSPLVPGEPVAGIRPDASQVTAVRAREIRPSDVAVGDLVGLVGDVSGSEGSLARLIRVLPRTTSLRRTADDSDPVERVVVANADQVCIVVAAADPEPRPRLIDRTLVAAWDAGAEPLLCVTKSDLTAPGPLVAGYADVDLRWVTVTSHGWEGLEALREALQGRVTALVGPSGVGKSTLVNALSQSAARRTGGVNTVTGRGRHTSVSAVVLPVTGGGWVVDTPGVRSFGLAHISPEGLLQAFGDLAPGAQSCPRGCTHDKADCALDAWVASGGAGPAGAARLSSYRRLLSALRGE